MARDLDELFGGDDAVRPRLLPVWGVLGAGMVLAVLGLACSVIPGAGLVLLSWWLADREVRRVESGYLHQRHAAAVLRARWATWACVVVCLALLVTQMTLLCAGFYGPFWEGWVQSVASWLEGVAPAVPPADPTPLVPGP